MKSTPRLSLLTLLGLLLFAAPALARPSPINLLGSSIGMGDKGESKVDVPIERVGSTRTLDRLPLTQSHLLTNLGYLIDYPEGWFAGTKNTFTAITQRQDDRQRLLASNFAATPGGTTVILGHVSPGFFGLPPDATLADLVRVVAADLTLDATAVRDTELLGVPAQSFSAVDDQGVHMLVNTGFHNGRVLIFGAFAPSEEALDVFTPTFEVMLESLRPMREAPEAESAQATPAQVTPAQVTPAQVTMPMLTGGTWQSSDQAITLRFNADGSYRGAYALSGLPFDVGRYQLQGATLTLHNGDRSPICPGMSGSYELTLTGEGQLGFVLGQDSCENRGGYFPTVPWNQIQP